MKPRIAKGPSPSLRAKRGNPCPHASGSPHHPHLPRYFGSIEVESLLGDPTKAKEKLGWVPEITLDQMVAEMVASDLADAKKHALLKRNGCTIVINAE